MRISKFITSFLCLQILVPLVSASEDQLQITIQGIRSERGKVYVAVFNEAQGFPSEDSKAIFRRIIEVSSSKTLSLSLPLNKAGQYAVAAYHDENNNNKIDIKSTGSPKEGFGTSNNVRAILGPPKFNDAKFVFPEKKQITLKLKY